VNEELRAIYEADQADREGNRMADGTAARDRDRERRVAELLAAGEVVDGTDHFYAAQVFQHGQTLNSYRRARELALRAAELGHRPARRLAAAALDRLLIHQGKPQKYGTQYWMPAGELLFVEVDPATTDEERAEWDVAPLAAALELAHGVVIPPPERPRTGR